MTIKSVDVLAVMDAEVMSMREIETWFNEANRPRASLIVDEAVQNMADARAAVSELIEAAIAMHITSPSWDWTRLWNAIATCRGDK